MGDSMQPRRSTAIPAGDPSDEFPARAGDDGCRTIAPTDLAQYIRLQQCRRYLRLRLHERAAGQRAVRRYAGPGQEIPPLLTRSGTLFEARVYAEIERHTTLHRFDGDDRGNRPADNDAVVTLVRDLMPGAVVYLAQPRIEAVVGSWNVRGDIDLLRIARTAAGLDVLVADIKSSTAAKIEHRLQVAFYQQMLASLLAVAGVFPREIATGLLYRGSVHEERADPEELARRAAEREAAQRLFFVADCYLEMIADTQSYVDDLAALVTGPDSVAEAVASAAFADVPFEFSRLCDGCVYSPLCMKWAAEHDDLSLLPYITRQEKQQLASAGIDTVAALIALKQPRVDAETGRERLRVLEPAPGMAATVARISALSPVGARLDELIQRGRRRMGGAKHGTVRSLVNLPEAGYSTFPTCSPELNPNLVTVCLDIQADYLTDRIYMAGALIAAADNGVAPPERERVVVRMAEAPPEDDLAERRLLIDWINAVLAAIVDVAAPSPDAVAATAPIHLVLWSRLEQQLLLQALGRHLGAVLGATPLYDLVSQASAYDSPIVTILETQVRKHKNHAIVAPSLQVVARRGGFDWGEHRDRFRERLFDGFGVRDDIDEDTGPRWYERVTRFASQIPLEYAYAAWNELPDDAAHREQYDRYRHVDGEILLDFEAARLRAMLTVARDLPANRETALSPFRLPDLATWEKRARNLAEALEEFMALERHVELGAWKARRNARAERRVLDGETLVVEYRAADQDGDVAEINRQNLAIYDRQQAAAAQPDGVEDAPREHWSQDGLAVRLRVVMDDIPLELERALDLSGFDPGDYALIFPRWTVDSRKPKEEQIRIDPTPKQMLYGGRGVVVDVEVPPDGAVGPREAFITVAMRPWRHSDPPFTFASSFAAPFREGERYTIETDPNSIHAGRLWNTVQWLIDRHPNTLFARMTGDSDATVSWPAEATAGQTRFLDGLDAMHRAGALPDFEHGKRAFIGAHGGDALLLVQGPPGTGKSYTTAFAILARLQGAMAAGQPLRVLVSARTHAATDVLLTNIRDASEVLRDFRTSHPDLFHDWFDDRLAEVPLFRADPREPPEDGITPVAADARVRDGELRPTDALARHEHAVLAATPSAIYKALKRRWSAAPWGRELAECLVIDEASQMSLPEGMMAALPLTRQGQIIVVGDHRQMAPITHHDWAGEARRTFQEYEAYASLFDTLLARDVPIIRFEESFRLHRDLAEVLRREIYAQDGIPYFSRRDDAIAPGPEREAFIRAVLCPDYPLTLVVHDEQESQKSNPFEQRLIEPVLAALIERGLSPEDGIGVVVPHRAQRAALRAAMQAAFAADPDKRAAAERAVDTVERYQGDEREIMIFSATESDPSYLLAASEFLFNPKRLTVALSRAKLKMIVIAAKSVFDLFSPDEETFVNTRFWKNLVRRIGTILVWEGAIDGRQVRVFGNPPLVQDEDERQPPGRTR
jgi:hypothetical protein